MTAFSLNVVRTKKDFMRFVWFLQPRIWGRWRPLIQCGLLATAIATSVFFLAVAWADAEGFHPDDLEPLAVGAATLACFAILVWILAPTLIGKIFPPNYITARSIFMTPCVIEVDDQGVRQFSGTTRSEVDWPAIHEIASKKEFEVLLTDVTEGIFIPHGCFQSNDQLSEFREFSRHAIRRADTNRS